MAAACAPGLKLTRLHSDILDFVAAVSATPEERIKRSAALQFIQDAVKVSFKSASQGTSRIQALAFGSHVNGLDSHRSDLDVVIVGLLSPDSKEHQGYKSAGRVEVNRHLANLKSCLFRKGMVTCVHIRNARLPILKCKLRSGAELDVSISNDSGVKAAQFLATEVRNRRALRPLVLVVKMLLRHEGLADGSSGGLSSFALALMAIAHLKASEKERGRVIEDLGVQLPGFLDRFGRKFDLIEDGIAPGKGGIVPKAAVPAMRKVLQASSSSAKDRKHQDSLKRFCIEDPLTGREIAGGCYKAVEVLQAFANGASSLETHPLLGALLDVSAALERSTTASAHGAVNGIGAALQNEFGRGRGGGGGVAGKRRLTNPADSGRQQYKKPYW